MATVEILSCTTDPIQHVSMCAGTCYDKRDYSEKRVMLCYNLKHHSVFEHVTATFRVTDVSRACTHQLVRHRIASYSQQSQRYVKVDAGSDDWYVIPPAFLDDAERLEAFKRGMREAWQAYLAALEAGLKPGDARYLLPEATKTEIVVTMNLREIYHFLTLRTDKKAHWEIRDLAWKLCQALEGINPSWQSVISLWRGDAVNGN